MPRSGDSCVTIDAVTLQNNKQLWRDNLSWKPAVLAQLDRRRGKSRPQYLQGSKKERGTGGERSPQVNGNKKMVNVREQKQTQNARTKGTQNAAQVWSVFTQWEPSNHVALSKWWVLKTFPALRSFSKPTVHTSSANVQLHKLHQTQQVTVHTVHCETEVCLSQ